jgi:hypothetical protein
MTMLERLLGTAARGPTEDAEAMLRPHPTGDST